MNLYCLPFAGGSSISYRGMYSHLDSFITPVFLEIPGHGSRAREPLLKNLDAIVDDCFETILHDNLEIPYAFYGHSMGAAIGYLLTRRLHDCGLPLPEHQFYSGRQGPSVADKMPGRHLLSRDKFLTMLENFDGSPKEVLVNQELMEYFEPILRADFQACDSFDYQTLPPLPVPITVMFGDSEENSYEDFVSWQHETLCDLNVYSFEGGHFFIFSHQAKIGEIISTTLRSCCLV